MVTRTRGVAPGNPILECAFDSLRAAHGTLAPTDYGNQYGRRHSRQNTVHRTGRLEGAVVRAKLGGCQDMARRIDVTGTGGVRLAAWEFGDPPKTDPARDGQGAHDGHTAPDGSPAVQ